MSLLMMSKASQFRRVQAAVILRNSGAQIQALSVVSQDLIAALASWAHACWTSRGQLESP